MNSLFENADTCHWCEQSVIDYFGDLIDDFGSAYCEFHPAVFNSKTLQRNDKKAPHQTIEQVQRIITEDYLKKNPPQSERLVTDNVVHLSKRATPTQRKAAEKMLPRSGSMRARIYEAVKYRQYDGMTDPELEKLLNGKHQSVSSSRRSLVIDGFLADSGKVRKNSEGFECTVWVLKQFSVSPYLNGIG